MTSDVTAPSKRVLEPIDRASEILFGLIMVLSLTSALSVVTAGQAEVHTMVIGALGCNLAWGIIDAGLYLMDCLDERARNLVTLRAVQLSTDPGQARNTIRAALPGPIAAIVSDQQLEEMRTRMLTLPAPPAHSYLSKDDLLGAAAVCLLVFLSTLPVVLPFLIISDVQTSLRVSNAVAIVMLFFCGYRWARGTDFHPWLTGLVMVFLGCVMVAIAVALGG